MNLMNFFIHEVNSDFVISPYSYQNIIFVMIAIVSIVLILLFAKKIKQSKYEKKIKVSFAILLVVLEVSYHIHNIINGVVSVPLHISSFSTILSIIILLTDNEKLFNTLFFFGVLGGIAAFVMPDMLHYTYYHYRFYNFVLIHVGIMIVPLYYYKAYNYEVKLKSMYRIYLFLLVIAPIIILANFLLDKNYMFIGQKPDIIAKYLPEWPYFILVYLLIILVLFHALYLVMHFREITSSLRKMQKKIKVKKSYIKK